MNDELESLRERVADVERRLNIEKIADLERAVAEQQKQIAALTVRDERRESEHRGLLKTYEQATADREKLRRETDKEMTLFKDYWDERIAGWRQRLATGDGGDGEGLPALLREIATDTGALISEALAAQEARIMRRVSDRFEKLATTEGNLGEAIDRLLGERSPAADSGASAQ